VLRFTILPRTTKMKGVEAVTVISVAAVFFVFTTSPVPTDYCHCVGLQWFYWETVNARRTNDKVMTLATGVASQIWLRTLTLRVSGVAVEQ